MGRLWGNFSLTPKILNSNLFTYYSFQQALIFNFWKVSHRKHYFNIVKTAFKKRRALTRLTPWLALPFVTLGSYPIVFTHSWSWKSSKDILTPKWIFNMSRYILHRYYCEWIISNHACFIQFITYREQNIKTLLSRLY